MERESILIKKGKYHTVDWCIRFNKIPYDLGMGDVSGWYVAYVKPTRKMMEAIGHRDIDVVEGAPAPEHWGWTFAGNIQFPEESRKKYVWGWDYNHCGDDTFWNISNESSAKVEEEVKDIIKKLNTFIVRRIDENL